MSSSRFTLAAGAICLALSWSHGLRAEATDNKTSVVRLVADASAGPERVIAIGISSLANLRVAAGDIDIDWVVPGERSIASLLDESSDMALLDLGRGDQDALASGLGHEAVMAFWPAGDGEDAAADGHPGYLLVARPSVSGAFIQELLQRIGDDKGVLKAAQVDVDRLEPSVAMADLPLALHAGASAYLAAAGEPGSTLLAAAPASAASPPFTDRVRDQPSQTAFPDRAPLPGPRRDERSFTLYFKFDEAVLDRDDFLSVAEACRYAATLSAARFVISGHTDTVGSATYNDRLAGRRADAVAEAIRNDPRFREALSVVEYGEFRLAVVTDDEVPEPKNRRVEITILETN